MTENFTEFEVTVSIGVITGNYAFKTLLKLGKFLTLRDLIQPKQYILSSLTLSDFKRENLG